MQTFLPFPDIRASAAVLDRQRLGKQRVEGMQILQALSAPRDSKNVGWLKHPATQMWKQHKAGLVYYTYCMCNEWKRRGYDDSVTSFLFAMFKSEYDIAAYYYRHEVEWDEMQRYGTLPNWFGGRIHETHRAALLAKDFAHYSKFGWQETPIIAYYWPTDPTNVVVEESEPHEAAL
jgi:hypothetical protein